MPQISSLARAIEDMEHGVYDFTKNGECTGCGQCCSNYLPLSRSEIKDIARHIKKHGVKPCNHSYAPLAVPVAWDLTCPFLDETKPKDKCTIYSHRPLICRDFVCNKVMSESEQTRRKFQTGGYVVVDMRETFFGGV